jgi:uncharacterized protein YecE (DUF72 family)
MGYQERIGCCGFPVSKAKYFEAFKVVELQQTFYQPPELSLIEKWLKESPDCFEYTLKAWQLITHEPKSPTYRKLKIKIPTSKEKNYGSFKPTDEVFSAWERIREIAEILDVRIIVFQCPPSFRPTKENKQNLKKFFSSIKGKQSIFAWEPRGEWCEKEIKTICEEMDLVHVVDPLQAVSVYGRVRYYRLHGIGSYRYKYTTGDLEKLKGYAGYMHTYFMFNNVYMYENALAFKRLLKSVR